MGLFDKFIIEDDEYITEGFQREFGKYLSIVGVFKSFDKDNFSVSFTYYLILTVITVIFTLNLLYSSYLVLPNIMDALIILHIIIILAMYWAGYFIVLLHRNDLIHLFKHFYHDLNVFFYDMHPDMIKFKENHKKTMSLIMRVMVPMFWVGYSTLAILAPLLNLILDEEFDRVEDVVYKLAIPMYWPFQQNHFTGVILPILAQFIATLLAAGVLSGSMVFFLSINAHFYTQYVVLLHNIRSLEYHTECSLETETGFKGNIDYSSPTASKCLNRYIKDIVIHHNALIE